MSNCRTYTTSHLQFFDTFNQFTNSNENARIDALQKIFEELPQPNKMTINFILEHLIRYANDVILRPIQSNSQFMLLSLLSPHLTHF